MRVGPGRGRPAAVGPVRPPAGDDRGSVTAETAVVLPAFVLLVAAGVSAVAVGVAQLRCTDAAREGARAVARGEPQDRVVGAAQRVAPAGSRVAVSAEPDAVAVTVRARVALPGVAGVRLPGIDVAATAVAAPEPGVP